MSTGKHTLEAALCTGSRHARIDRRAKLLAYQTIPSLQSYLLVEQERCHVELYRRATGWQAERYGDGALPIERLDTSLSLNDIYADVA